MKFRRNQVGNDQAGESLMEVIHIHVSLFSPGESPLVSLKPGTFQIEDSTTEPLRFNSEPGFIQASLSKIQGIFKDFSRPSYSFQGLKF